MTYDFEELAERYCSDFARLFGAFDEEALLSSESSLGEIEEWFNGNNLLVSMLTDVPLGPISFAHGDPGPAQRQANCVALLHAYSMCYAAHLKMSAALGPAGPGAAGRVTLA